MLVYLSSVLDKNKVKAYIRLILSYQFPAKSQAERDPDTGMQGMQWAWKRFY